MKKTLFTLIICMCTSPLWASKEPALIAAARKGDLAQVQELLDKGEKIDQKNKSKQTALMVAAKQGHADVTALLLERGAKVDLEDASKSTLFHYAAMGGDVKLMETLKGRDLSYSLPDRNKVTPFLAAAQSGGKAALELLVSWGVNPNQKTAQGDTALHRAAVYNNVAGVQYLVGLGIPVDARGRNEGTPLMAAVLAGSTDTVEALLNLGADPEAADKDGNKPMGFVAFVRNRAMYRMICEHGWPGAALHCSVRGNALSEVQKLLAAGEPKNAANPVGETALFVAVSEGHLDIARELIDQGATVDAPTKYFWTPLYTAAWRGDLPMVKLLLARGAQANYPVAGGDTPIGIALEGGHQEVAAALIEAGANVLYYTPNTKKRRVFENIPFDELLTTRQEGMKTGEFEKSICPFWMIRYDEEKVRDADGLIVSKKDRAKKWDEDPQAEEAAHEASETKNQELIEQGKLDLPVFTKRVMPAYPNWALTDRVQGYLILQATLGMDGVARDIAVLRPLGDWRYGFELEAIKALRQWQFKPGTFNGEPCDVIMNLKIDFVMR